jgi:hypothetical protein
LEANPGRAELTNPLCFSGERSYPNIHGKDVSRRQVEKEAEIQVARGPALFPLRPEARLHEGFRPLPHLLPRIRQ